VIGSILSNILLVLGMCFLAGGTRFSEQGFSLAAVQINSSLLMLSVVAVLIPAGVHVATLLNATQKAITSGSATLESESDFSDILRISRGVAILLLLSEWSIVLLLVVPPADSITLVYVAYLVFQLWSHKDLYDDKDSIHVPKSIRWGEKRISASSADSISPMPTISPSPTDVEAARIPTETEEEEQPKTSLVVCIATLIVVTVLVGVTSEFLVGSIDGLSTSTGLPKEFVGLICKSRFSRFSPHC
jgi:Ca2+:H+ antiporter